MFIGSEKITRLVQPQSKRGLIFNHQPNTAAVETAVTPDHAAVASSDLLLSLREPAISSYTLLFIRGLEPVS